MAVEYIKIEDVLNLNVSTWVSEGVSSTKAANMAIKNFKEFVKQIAPANVVERKLGKWMEIRQGVIPSGYCSECEIWNRVTAYCPNCGAQMEIGDSDV